MRFALHALDEAVVAEGRDAQARRQSSCRNSLMVARVDDRRPGAKDLSQLCIRLGDDVVEPRGGAFSFDPFVLISGYVLEQATAETDVEELMAAADRQHG